MVDFLQSVICNNLNEILQAKFDSTCLKNNFDYSCNSLDSFFLGESTFRPEFWDLIRLDIPLANSNAHVQTSVISTYLLVHVWISFTRY